MLRDGPLPALGYGLYKVRRRTPDAWSPRAWPPATCRSAARSFPRAPTERLRENLDVDGFHLTEEDMAAFAALETGERTGTPPGDRQ